MRPFNLAEAKAGKPVCTRDGRKARVVSFNAGEEFPCIAIVSLEIGTEYADTFTSSGRVALCGECQEDLFMADEEQIIPKGWTKYNPNVLPPEDAEYIEMMYNKGSGINTREIFVFDWAQHNRRFPKSPRIAWRVARMARKDALEEVIKELTLYPAPSKEELSQRLTAFANAILEKTKCQ